MRESSAFRDPHELFAAQAARVLILGDLMLDEYLRGSVRRISPEAPVPVIEAATTEIALGGAANVANNLVALGCSVELCGVVGKDDLGNKVVELAAARGIGARGILHDPTRVTTHKLRAVAHGQQMVRIDREDRAALSVALEDEVLAFVEARLGETDGIVLSDYQKGFLTARILSGVIELAQRKAIPVVVDPKGTDYTRYRGVDILTPNLHEVEVATGMSVKDGRSLDHAAKLLLTQTEAKAVLVTCGKDGMALFAREGEPVRIAAEAREVYDVTGAGDTVVAVLMLALTRGFAYAEAARLANAAAGIVVGKLGTTTVSRGELLDRLHAREWDTGTKIIPRSALAAALAPLRRAGKRIVFTNGCFDILHVGHVDYLQAARQLGDLLIIGLNTDSSVQRVKGPTRPIVNEQARARVLAALACVDLVVFFDEPTPAEIIEAVHPDVLVKGADYKPHEVVGREFVESYGGRLELVPLVAGQSTTSIIDAIVARHGGTV